MTRFAEAASPSLAAMRSHYEMNASGQRRARLVKELEAAWRASSYPALGRLSAFLRDGVVVIRGAVPSFFLKQIAQEIAMRVRCGETIQNEIEVAGFTAPQVARIARGEPHGAQSIVFDLEQQEQV